METIVEARSLAPFWDVARIVEELRSVRERSLHTRQRSELSSKLPSRKAIQSVVDGLSVALFPNRLAGRQMRRESVDYFVGRTLDVTLRELAVQLELELRFSAQGSTADDKLRENANVIVREFAHRLPELRVLLEQDIAAAHANDPTAGSLDEVLVSYPGVTAVLHHRLAHELYRQGAPLVGRIVAAISHAATGIVIHPAAQIGPGFSINHGTGIVVSETVVIGESVCLHHGVTLGELRASDSRSCYEPVGARRHPCLEDRVVIYAGATILGPVTIGRSSIIGGSVWLTRDVPPGSFVTQASARREDFDSGSGI